MTKYLDARIVNIKNHKDSALIVELFIFELNKRLIIDVYQDILNILHKLEIPTSYMCIIQEKVGQKVKLEVLNSHYPNYTLKLISSTTDTSSLESNINYLLFNPYCLL